MVKGFEVSDLANANEASSPMAIQLTRWCCLAVVLGSSLTAVGQHPDAVRPLPRATQPPEAPPAPAAPADPFAQPAPAVQRDPTVPQGELRMLLNPAVDETGAPAPVAALPPLPPMEVRAKIIRGDGRAAALLSALQITGTGTSTFYQITPGQSFHLQGTGDWNLTILSIKREGVTMELQPGKRLLVLP